MSKTFTAYAAPMSWGPWTTIQSHGGSIAFKISYTSIGDTLVTGKVKYYKDNENMTEEEFKDEITIRTADVWANIGVCFKGIPLGSTVEGVIE
ncbi:hypothetical protein ACFOJE_20370 [Azotobacter bryophylli]|uniref:Uncharacterized protein n=1 Tax=Azotobacter bryophylli TaxID=1986537 RepID=A0ABV7AYB3_9GAMM